MYATVFVFSISKKACVAKNFEVALSSINTLVKSNPLKYVFVCVYGSVWVTNGTKYATALTKIKNAETYSIIVLLLNLLALTLSNFIFLY